MTVTQSWKWQVPQEMPGKSSWTLEDEQAILDAVQAQDSNKA